jgi:hypothetical protein
MTYNSSRDFTPILKWRGKLPGDFTPILKWRGKLPGDQESRGRWVEDFKQNGFWMLL